MKHFYFHNAVLDLQKAEAENGMWLLSEQGRGMLQAAEKAFEAYDPAQVSFTVFVPELYLTSAAERKGEGSAVELGILGIKPSELDEEVLPLTGKVPAAARQAMHCETVLVGSYEEKREKFAILRHGGVSEQVAVSAIGRLCNEELIRAQASGGKVVYCIGETKEEYRDWKATLGQQLSIGLAGVDPDRLVIAYEPIWDKHEKEVYLDFERTMAILRWIKSEAGDVPVVYGGKLNQKAATSLAKIPELDGIYFAPGSRLEDNLSLVQAYLLPERCTDCVFLK